MSTSTVEPVTDEGKPKPSQPARRRRLTAVAAVTALGVSFGIGVAVDHIAIRGGSAALDGSPARTPVKSADGSPSWTDWLGQTTWYTYPMTNLKDPTPLKTFTLDCGAQKVGDVALYPYIANSSADSYDYSYRNLSTNGVDVSSDGVGHTGDANGYLNVASNHDHGDYGFSVSYECSANSPENNNTFIQSVAASNITSTSADVSTTYYNASGSGTVSYQVQYGTAAGVYDQNTGWLQSPMPSTATYGVAVASLTGLQPGTTYHFRTVETENGPDASKPNYSGADQTFTTAAN